MPDHPDSASPEDSAARPVPTQRNASRHDGDESTSGDDDSARSVADAVQYDESAGWTPPTWEEVVREHSARVFRLAYRLTGNRHDAEDLTQDVFIRVFRSLSSYKPGTFEGWLHRITTNLFLDQVRRKKRIRFDALGDDAADRLSGREPAPDRVITDKMLDADVQSALDQLAPDFRAAVVLCDVEGLSYEEIAATLDIKLGTVRSRIHRGRAQLRGALEHRAPGTRGAAADDAVNAAAADAATAADDRGEAAQ